MYQKHTVRRATSPNCMLRTPSSHPVSKGVVIVIPIRKIHLHKLVYEDFADAVVICDIRLDQTTTLLQKKQCKFKSYIYKKAPSWTDEQIEDLYCGAEVWLDRWVLPNCCIARSALQGSSSVTCTLLLCKVCSSIF
jgi:hypothetical protein